jgi:hypothetical protein
MPERIIRRNEEPGAGIGTDDRPCGSGCRPVGVPCPVDAGRRASFAGKIRRSWSRDQNNLIERLCDFYDGEPDGRIRQVSNDIDMLDIEPLVGLFW